jgi:Domain of unknown function (DUF5134)
VTGPSWLAAPVAALMLLIAASCAVRLTISRARGRATEADADGLHLLMGVAMAGMLEPRLSPVPGAAWQVMFAAATAWFGWQAIRTPRHRPDRWRCAHPAPHAVECAAMVYMLLPARSPGHSPAMAMPGMSGPAAAAGSNPAIALVLALFMLGYVLWTTDRLAALSRVGAAAAGHPGAGSRLAPAGSEPITSGPLNPGSSAPSRASAVAAPLAPRFAACYKIAMSVAMGYMLITML